MTRFLCKRIAIIGAGPSGLAAAKYFQAEKSFDLIDVYEQRSEVGGLWNQTPHLVHDEEFKIPQTSPFGSLEKPFWQPTRPSIVKKESQHASAVSDTRSESGPQFLSPVYDTLETNIPLSLMRYSDTPFPEDTQLFPKHQEVEAYLMHYSKDIRHLIKFSTQVTNVSLLDSPVRSVEADAPATGPQEGALSHWALSSVSLLTGETSQILYDAVILGNGHYNVPYIPSIPGIEKWNEAFPGSITHAKYYRRPEDYRDKKLIVVGNSASGLDIGTQLVHYCRSPLFMSAKSSSYLAAAFPGLEEKVDLPPITSFDASTKTIRFADDREEVNVDAIVFCTGYFYSYPFIPSLQNTTTATTAQRYPIITNGLRVCNTYKHLFYAPHPTLAFLALTQKVIPFPLAEAQAAVLARVYAGRLTLPPLEAMQAWEQTVLDNLGEKGERDFHTLSFPRDAEYINDLCDWAASADGENKEGQGFGKKPQRWGAWHYWARERFPQIRRAFVEQGEARKDMKRLEDVGFDFDAYLKEKKEEEKEL